MIKPLTCLDWESVCQKRSRVIDALFCQQAKVFSQAGEVVKQDIIAAGDKAMVSSYCDGYGKDPHAFRDN